MKIICESVDELFDLVESGNQDFILADGVGTIMEGENEPRGTRKT